MKPRAKELQVIVDECLEPDLVEALLALPAAQFVTPTIRHLVRDILKREGVRDEDWVPMLRGYRDVVVISCDRGKLNGRKGVDLPVLCHAEGIAHVLLSSSVSKLKKAQKIEAVCTHWQRIQTMTTTLGHGSRHVIGLVSRTEKTSDGGPCSGSIMAIAASTEMRKVPD